MVLAGPQWRVVGEGHAPPGAMPPTDAGRRKTVKAKGLSLRGPEGDVAISCRQLRFRRKYPVIRPATARLPRRFAPRNDTSGWCGGGNGALHRIRSSFAASRTGAACRSPTNAIGAYRFNGSVYRCLARPDHRCLNSTNFIIARRRTECKPEIGQEFSLTCRNIRQRR